jgi:hypothetical protein
MAPALLFFFLFSVFVFSDSDYEKLRGVLERRIRNPSL